MTRPDIPQTSPSPEISSVAWGRMEVDGFGTFKDAKLYPGGAREWDWGETGTRHDPGIQPSDVEEILSLGVSVVVMGRGMLRRLKVRPDTLNLLESKGVEVRVLETKEAVRTYNELRQRTSVGGLFHTTC